MTTDISRRTARTGAAALCGVATVLLFGPHAATAAATPTATSVAGGAAGAAASSAPTAGLRTGGATATVTDVAHLRTPVSPDESVVVVRVGGERTGPDAVGPLAGVRLGLYTSTTTYAPADPVWAVCTSDASGECVFTVPQTGPGQKNAGAVLYVEQLPNGVPAGWYTDPQLLTGPGGPFALGSAYVFATPALEGGHSYDSTADFMSAAGRKANPLASDGVWQQSRDNPPLAPQCGLDVALVMELPPSVGSELPNLRRSAYVLAQSLVGTASKISLFSFDKSSPSTSVGTDQSGPISVSTQAGADSFEALYANWQLGGGANWDQALYSVARAPEKYQVAIVLTDDAPDYSGTPALGDGGQTSFGDVEDGVFAANALKAKGTRIIAIGIGQAMSGAAGLDLRAISGPTAYDATAPNFLSADYYQLTGYQAAASVMHSLVMAQCENSLSVVTAVAPSTSDGPYLAGALPVGAGWTSTATITSSDDGTGTSAKPVSETRSTTDGGNGGVVFESNTSGSASDPSGSAQIHVAEQQRSGYHLLTEGGHDAVCTNLVDGSSVGVSDDSASGQPGFTVAMQQGSSVTCTVYEQAGASGASSAPRASLASAGTDATLPALFAGLAAVVVGVITTVLVRRRPGARHSAGAHGVTRPGQVSAPFLPGLSERLGIPPRTRFSPLSGPGQVIRRGKP